MKTMFSILAAVAVLTMGAAYAETAMNQERVSVQNEIQNRFKTMNTDELLEKRGTMTTQQEREALHNELMSRQSTMTQEQKEKFMKRPENRVPKMKNMSPGSGMGKGRP